MERVDVTLPMKEVYAKKAVPALFRAFGWKNAFAAPRVKKVVVNVGLGKFLKEDARVEEIVRTLGDITGQKAVLTKAKKAISGFKIREGLSVGAMVTLRGERMWSFLDRLVKATFPRIRDFQGFALSSVDGSGNFNAGLKEQIVFPEVIPEKVQTNFGLQVTVVTSAKNQEEGLVLLRALGFPLRDN